MPKYHSIKAYGVHRLSSVCSQTNVLLVNGRERWSGYYPQEKSQRFSSDEMIKSGQFYN
jgi:hypothetical protein